MTPASFSDLQRHHERLLREHSFAHRCFEDAFALGVKMEAEAHWLYKLSNDLFEEIKVSYKRLAQAMEEGR